MTRPLRLPTLAFVAAITAMAGSAGLQAAVAAGSGEGPATPTASGNWSQFHEGVTHHGFQASESVISVASAPTLELKWKHQTGDRVQSSPAVVGGILYVGSWDGYLYALDASSGALKWKYKTGSMITTSGPAVVSGVVYVGAENGTVYAVNASNGSLKWKRSIGGSIRSSPAVSGGTLYIGNMVKAIPTGMNGYVYALNANTGGVKWVSDKTWAVRTSPAVADGKVFFGSDASKVFALNATTGAQIWAHLVLGMVRSSPAVGNGLVYIGDDGGQLYALDIDNGAVTWKTGVLHVATEIKATPAIAYNKVYIDTGERLPMISHVYAFDAATGRQKWVTQMFDWTSVSPSIANGVLFTSPSRYVEAYDAQTGEHLWEDRMIGDSDASPAVSNGIVYYASNDGAVYAFSPS